jgi:hypothetical protein
MEEKDLEMQWIMRTMRMTRIRANELNVIAGWNWAPSDEN